MTTTIAKKLNGNPSVNFGNVVDNIFQNSLRHFFDGDSFPGNTSLNKVPVNIAETDQAYRLDVIAPGLEKKNFVVQLHDNMLTVSYNRSEQTEKKDEWIRNEYSLDSFSRTFTLDETVDTNHVEATYENGILRIELAKNEKAKRISRNIVIK
jgi:HSP20 family protein